MRRKSDAYVNATHILKVANLSKPQRTKILECEVHVGHHQKVQGGYGKYQGTWVPLPRAIEIARRFAVEDEIRPLFDYVPRSPSPVQAHAKPKISVRARKPAVPLPDRAAGGARVGFGPPTSPGGAAVPGPAAAVAAAAAPFSSGAGRPGSLPTSSQAATGAPGAAPSAPGVPAPEAAPRGSAAGVVPAAGDLAPRCAPPAGAGPGAPPDAAAAPPSGAEAGGAAPAAAFPGPGAAPPAAGAGAGVGAPAGGVRPPGVPPQKLLGKRAAAIEANNNIKSSLHPKRLPADPGLKAARRPRAAPGALAGSARNHPAAAAARGANPTSAAGRHIAPAAAAAAAAAAGKTNPVATAVNHPGQPAAGARRPGQTAAAVRRSRGALATPQQPVPPNAAVIRPAKRYAGKTPAAPTVKYGPAGRQIERKVKEVVRGPCAAASRVAKPGVTHDAARRTCVIQGNGKAGATGRTERKLITSFREAAELYATLDLGHFTSADYRIPQLLLTPPPNLDINMSIDQTGNTALHWAAASGRI
ncbi:MAG: hypothetical protein BJ554DRAFT_4353, partial [Olpidium bornovanus]